MNTENVEPRIIGSGALLSIWFASMPEWAKHAFHNCPTVQRVMRDCAMRETSKAEMQWEVCAALYEQRNQWRDTASNLADKMPIRVEMPNDKLSDPAH